jgi:CRP-like cAMP-binding protein
MSGPELLIQSLEKHVALNPQEQHRVLLAFTSLQLKKRDFFLRAGEVCKHVAFVLNGCLRSYAVDEQGFEHNLQFAPEGWWITDMNSIINHTEARLNIDAVEDSQALLLSRDQQESLLKEVPKIERFFRIISEKSMAGSHKRLIDQVSVNAQERYLNFCQQYPGLIQRLPQKQIASYIGVTPEFLSKIKSDLLRRKN